MLSCDRSAATWSCSEGPAKGGGAVFVATSIPCTRAGRERDRARARKREREIEVMSEGSPRSHEIGRSRYRDASEEKQVERQR